MNVLPLKVPSLREREGDVSILARVLLEEMAANYKRDAVHLSEAAVNLLESHSWPGNVRELSNALEHALVHSGGSEILPNHFPSELLARRVEQKEPLPVPVLAVEQPTPRKTVGYYKKPDDETERRRIEEVLRQVGGNKVQAAKRLEMSRTTLWKRIRQYGLG